MFACILKRNDIQRTRSCIPSYKASHVNTCSYQRTRLYTRIALGKARAMDVVSGESSGNFGQLVLLYPLLFWLQALQANIGVSMMLRGYGALFSPEGWLVGCYLRSCYPYVTCAPVMPER